eukprot:COSAG01_NODE_64543_length_276_cov_0.587571_1_plen_60_part_10
MQNHLDDAHLRCKVRGCGTGCEFWVYAVLHKPCFNDRKLFVCKEQQDSGPQETVDQLRGA